MNGIPDIHTQRYRGFMFAVTTALGRNSMDELLRLIRTDATLQPEFLAGRAPVKFISLSETGPLVVKTCNRGGLLSRLNRHHHVRWKKTRPQKEMEFLFHAMDAGVKVPGPIAFITRGNFFYRAWLITTAIDPHISFAALCRTQPEKARALLPEISRNIGLLIDACIFHVDLHPGNILITPDNCVHIIDFDKAIFFNGKRTALIQKYMKRWTRAIKKYDLPKFISKLCLKNIPR